MKLKVVYKVFFIRLLSLFLFIGCDYKHTNSQQKSIVPNDSISLWIKESKSTSYTLKKRDSLLGLAYQSVQVLHNDSLKISYLSSIAYQLYKVNQIEKFKRVNEKALKMAIKQKDSFFIADIHWNYASYYNNREIYDKSYYHYNAAYPYFNSIGKEYEAARMLYSMAFIKGRYRDYTGSEVLNIEAIKKFKKVNHNKYLYESYNHLANLQNDIHEYDQAILYHQMALKYLEKVRGKKNYYAVSLNNIGSSHLKKGDYNEAIKFFNESLKENKNIENFARIIDNRAFARLKLGDTVNVHKDMQRALIIRDSLNNKAAVVFSKIRISKYYSYKLDTLAALKYAKEANILAKEIKNGVDYLESLKLLANLQPLKAKSYLEEHIRYNDSLIDAERKTLNKFTRIEFETDEVIKSNKILTQQRIWIFAASIVLILILTLLYFIRIQRARNEKLFLETEQQKANEQVYLLTLKKQAELEEEKVRERNRISQELHDGILGRLFGTRVGMGFLDIGNNEKTRQKHDAFLEELQDIEKEIREVSHKLNDTFESSDVNFTTIVTQLLESKSKVGDFQFHMNIDQNISWKSTDEIIKVNVYRIIQETLQNTIKHANAKNVTLDFSFCEKDLVIQIKDDGVGFNLRKSKKGIGLKNMKSRVEKLNGTFVILSAPNEGTQIRIKIPIE